MFIERYVNVKTGELKTVYSRNESNELSIVWKLIDFETFKLMKLVISYYKS